MRWFETWKHTYYAEDGWRVERYKGCRCWRIGHPDCRVSSLRFRTLDEAKKWVAVRIRLERLKQKLSELSP